MKKNKNKNKTVLVIASHPDDEILGCGGTMARHINQGDAVHVVILAEGATSRDAARSRKSREQELNNLAEALMNLYTCAIQVNHPTCCG